MRQTLYTILTLTVFALGVYSHIGWVWAQGVSRQVQACQYTNCVEQLQLAAMLDKQSKPVAVAERVPLPNKKPTKKKG